MRRILDVFASAAGLVFLSPVLLMIAIAILRNDGRPILFRQIRVGRNGIPFVLLKFRSMRVGLSGTSITAAGDDRITSFGRVARRYKLDELPQLFNVLRGDMSLIGPRPEVPRFVDMSNDTWQHVLSVKPGLTDVATLLCLNEEEILSQTTDAERHYSDVVLPAKLAVNMHYLRTRTVGTDLKLLLLTLLYSLVPAIFHAKKVKQHFLIPETTSRI